MKKLLYLLPLLLGIFACGTQPQSTRDVTDIVNGTLTAIAQNNPQMVAPQITFTPVPTQVQPIATQAASSAQPTAAQVVPTPLDPPAPTGNMTYFWPLVLPEGFVLSRENSRADAGGFVLTFIDSNQGIVLRLLGGSEADQYKYCVSLENYPGEPVTVRGVEGCFPAATGGGFTVEWKENGTHYIVGGMGVSREFALATAGQLESLALSAFLARLVP